MASVELVFELFPWFGYLIAGIFGLVFGSFFTFLFYRIQTGQPWLYGKGAGRSKCPSCHHILGARDLVPVLSWVMMRGQCRYCGTSVSIRYPIIEIATATVFMCLYGVFLLPQ